MLSGKNVLVTGGCGFIGSGIVRRIAEGSMVNETLVLDRAGPGKAERLSGLGDKIKLITADIKNPKDYEERIKGTDIIFHQAAFVSVPESIRNPSDAFETNVLGTVKLLETCRRNNIGRFIFASTAAVYGEHAEPVKEKENLNPSSPYGLSKLMAEDYCRIYSKLYGIKTTCLRYFNAYGPGQERRKNIISVISDSLMTENPLTVYGDGEQTRDYVHLSDIIEANLLAASNSKLLKGEAVNIGTGNAVSINNLIDIMEELSGKKLKVLRTEPREGDVIHSTADVSLAKEALKFEAKIMIDDGLKSTMKEK